MSSEPWSVSPRAKLHGYIGGLSQWYLGALVSAAQTLEAVPVPDEVMGIAGSLRLDTFERKLRYLLWLH